MNPKSVKKHICEELAHGKPIQLILKPKPPLVWGVDEDGNKAMVPDEDWVQPDLPDWNLVVQWLGEDEAFRKSWENARKYGASYLADSMLILKDQLLADPKNATAYKTAMEMIKVSAMWGDPKYSERTIQEVKNTTPQDDDTIKARIKQLQEELGIGPQTIEMGPVVEEKKRTPAQLAHYQKMREARERKLRERRGKSDD